ncbi:hypothetical protein [Pelagibius sp. Alg239-R121]|uniref:hypothetical protein n=1 Tax=Pelagibius sp. Alg239-R121 TaxID=2993448 RepID=UPI0024A64B67|nr:hypothetical protein [Pelagibius sp. Alg239-R121]
MTSRSDLSEGARNLLQHCGDFTAGSEILIVHEDPAFGWYDNAAPLAVAAEAEALGLKPRLVKVGAPSDRLAPETTALIEQYDNCIFFSRIGDQDRFAEVPAGKTKVMSYIRSAEMLASEFGRTNHEAMLVLKKAIDAILRNADRIEITCPLGSYLTGVISDAARSSDTDVSVRRFPMGVPQPIEALEFGGRVALSRYLTPTGSRVYDPPFLKIGATAFAHVAQGRIEFFSGDTETIRLVERHYERVSNQFGIDPQVVHSWHAGIHPGSSYDQAAGDDPDRWSNTVFTNPRILHFHTCGAYAPGEICWMLMDHTVRIDGVALWEDGAIHPERFAQTSSCLDQWPELRPIFENPSPLIGI